MSPKDPWHPRPMIALRRPGTRDIPRVPAPCIVIIHPRGAVALNSCHRRPFSTLPVNRHGPPIVMWVSGPGARGGLRLFRDFLANSRLRGLASRSFPIWAWAAGWRLPAVLDGVRRGVEVAEDFQEVDEVGLLGGGQTRDCPPGRSLRSPRWFPWRPPGRGCSR